MPTVIVCTDSFSDLARLVAREQSLPEVRIVEVPHPVGGLSTAEVEAKADEVTEDVIAAFSGSKPADGSASGTDPGRGDVGE